ncbi:MAG: hypothetical protein IJY38_01555, partial [Clostridia bacterium]|nr:hypothetical protein [Clostridia bacterium]
NAVFGRINTLGSEAGGNIVGGERNSTNAGRSVIGGLNNQVDHSECGVFGRYLQTGRADQLVCGRYNEPDENAMFIVGYDAVVSVGTRTNIFTVNKNGTATVYKDPVKNLDVATKQYVDNAISNSANDVATKEYVDNAISNLSVGGTSEIKRYLHRIVIDCSSNEGVIFYFAFINNNSEPYTFEDYTFDESDFPFELLFKNFKIEVESETLFGFITESYYSGRSLSLECYINEAGYASFYIDLGSGDSITDDVFEIV